MIKRNLTKAFVIAATTALMATGTPMMTFATEYDFVIETSADDTVDDELPIKRGIVQNEDTDGDTDAGISRIETEDRDGDVDGDTDGYISADTDEDIDGDTNGDIDGDTDGDSDGDMDGDTDGDIDGDTDGDIDGDTDSDMDDDTDDDMDDDTDEDMDGDTDGDIDEDTDHMTKKEKKFDDENREKKETYRKSRVPKTGDHNAIFGMLAAFFAGLAGLGLSFMGLAKRRFQD